MRGTYPRAVERGVCLAVWCASYYVCSHHVMTATTHDQTVGINAAFPRAVEALRQIVTN